MISSVMTITARVAITGILTVSCFKRTVVDNTAQVLSEAEKVSAGLVAYSVCMSTITLVLAADAAAQRILSNDAKPAAPKNDDADFNPPSTNDNTTSATPNTVELHHLQPSPSPSRLIESQPSPVPSPLRLIEPQSSPSQSLSSLHVIESTETISAPITCCTCTPCINLTSPNLYCKRLSIDSDTTLLPCDDVFLDDASDTDDYESFDDESTVHEDDHSGLRPRKEYALDQTTLDTLIARMNTLTLDDPLRPSKLRPLILVANRNTTTTIPYPPLPETTYPMDALTRRMQARPLSDSRPSDPGVSLPGCTIDTLTRSMEARSLSDRPSSTSKLRPLILVTKRAAGRHKPLAPASTLLRQPKTKSTTRSQTYWSYSLSPTTWSPPAQVF